MKKLFKSFVAFSLSLMMIFCSVLLGASALFSGSCGETLTWSFDDDSGTLTLSGTGEMYDYAIMHRPWHSLSDEIKSVIIESGVTSVCDMAFYDCRSLETISISDTVSSIGDLAFSQSYAVISISVDPANTSYSSDANGALFNKAKSVLILYPASETSTQYVVPSTVTEICTDAFRFNKNLNEVILPDGLATIGEDAFYGSALKSVTIPSSVTSIGKNAFGWCPALERIDVNPSNANYSGDSNGVLFSADKTELIKFPSDCAVSSYTIPEGTVTLADDSFENCNNLEEITLPASLTDIGNGTFFNCNLKFIYADSENQNYANDSYGVLYSKDKTTLISYPAGSDSVCYVIPEGTSSVNDNAFYGADNIEYIHFDKSVTDIGNEITSGSNIRICAETEACAAYEYANDNNISFVLCSGHEADGITVSETEISVTNKQTYQLTATVTPESASDKSVVWTSDNTDVVTTDENGLVTAVSCGTAKVTASTADGRFSAECKVTVNPRKFNITWIIDEKEIVQSFDEGAKITAPEIPEKEGYSFIGWTPEIPEVMPENDLIFTDIWDAKSYNAVFDANGGKWVDGLSEKTYSYKFGTKIYAPREPAREGYIFEGWTPEIGTMDSVSGKSFTAVWSASQDTPYTVEIYTMNTDGTYSTDTQALTGTTDTEVSASYTVEDGFVLNTEKSVLSGNINADGSLVLKVYLDRIIYTVTFNGTEINCLYGAYISEPDAPETPEGHLQEGWIDENGNAVVFPLVADENFPAEINPCFVRQSYTLRWIVDGEETEESYLFEEKITAPENPSKTGYTFAGWSPEVPDTMPSSSLEFTAVWTVNSYASVFDANTGYFPDGTDKITVSTEYDAVIVPPVNPVKDGYVFCGWTPDVGIMNDINGKKFTAVWAASTDTLYKVEVYTMNTDGTYSTVTQTFTGTTDTEVSASYTVEDGFVLNTEKSVLSGTVKADNSLVLQAYIDRKSYTVTTIVDGVSTSVHFLFGAAVVIENPIKDEYDFTGWDNKIPETMPAENLTFTAGFTKTIYTCPDCHEEFDNKGLFSEHLAYELEKKSIRVSIKNNPGTKTINHGETLKLTAVTSAKLPTGTKICWYVNDEFKGEGETFEISFDSGTKTVTVKITDENGNVLKDADSDEISDSQKVSVNSGLWQKIVSFFKNLFRINRTVVQVIFENR